MQASYPAVSPDLFLDLHRHLARSLHDIVLEERRQPFLDCILVEDHSKLILLDDRQTCIERERESFRGGNCSMFLGRTNCMGCAYVKKVCVCMCMWVTSDGGARRGCDVL